MDQPTRKQRLTPLHPLIDAGFEGPPEHLLCTQGVAGSNPVVSTSSGLLPRAKQLRSRSHWSEYRCSPASMATGRAFSGGASGQSHRMLYAHDGLYA